MGNAPLRLRPCLEPRCPALVESATGGRCAQHARLSGRDGWSSRQQDGNVTRVRGRRLQRLREHLFSHEPLCRVCYAAGRFALAAVRDHIVPLAEGGTDDETNIQPLCQDCSDEKTRAEAQRGQARAR